MTKKWFSIATNKAGKTNSADIYLFDYIGGWEIDARDFIGQLKGLDVDHINLHINSPGGVVTEGIAIQNSLRHHNASVTVHIDGIAASIASIIALAGDDIRIADNAYVMIHNPTSLAYGEAKDMLKEAEILNKITDGLAGDYSRKMGISIEDARELMDEETWYLGQEAIDAGFADSLFEGSKATAHFDIERFANRAPKEALERFAIASQNIHKRENVNMKKKGKKTDVTDTQTPDNEDVADDTVVDDDQDTTTQTQAANENETVNVENAVQAALKAERKRTAEINEIGEKFGFMNSAKEFVADGKSVEDFRAHILNKSPEDWRASLAIKNPAQQDSEQDLQNKSDGEEVVATIKARRQNN